MSENVIKGDPFDRLKLAALLHQNDLINSPKSDLQVNQFSNGYSNLTYELRIEEKAFVLRMPPPGAIKRGHDMGREFKVLSNLRKGFNQCPTAYFYEESSEICKAPFYIMEKIDGIILTFKEAKNRKISPPEYHTISDTWLQGFVDLHAVNFEDIGLSDLGKPDGYVNRQVSNWSKQYIKAKTEEVKQAELVMHWLDENQPTEYDSTLIHNDYKYDNVVFEDNTWKSILAILDWEMCTLGDPLMDLGTSIAYWTMSSDGDLIKQGLPSPTLFEGNPGRHDIVQSYSKLSGRQISNLVFYYAFGLFKIAVIAQQIYYRYNKGLTSDQKFANLDKSSQFLCLCAWQAIQKNKIENLF